MSTTNQTIQIPAFLAPDIIAALTLVVNTQRIELARIEELDKQNDELLAEIDDLNDTISALKAGVEGLMAERDHYRVALNAHNNTALPDHIVDVTAMLPSDPPWKLPLPTTPEGWGQLIRDRPEEFVRQGDLLWHRSVVPEYAVNHVAFIAYGGVCLYPSHISKKGMASATFKDPEIRAALDAIPVRTEAKETTQ